MLFLFYLLIFVLTLVIVPRIAKFFIKILEKKQSKTYKIILNEQDQEEIERQMRGLYGKNVIDLKKYKNKRKKDEDLD